ncbi:MAG TPA: sigma-54-dependent transcriptional regulator, partial [Candidatus Wunengus sp. YC63]|uniref:sigma-54-dependent transcriptional regulator n=1 Tax=Candidatus Wunengus sp. YC63 TaxID=3367699 RepID=UPI004026B32D
MATDSNISVLIIDDEVDMCDMLSHVLNQAGFATYIAHDGNTGLEVFNKESPSVVILDLRMPGINGMDVLKQIKHTSSETPVIIITAYGEIQSAVEAIKHGAYNYFNKPFDNEEVVVTVEKAIEERAMRQEIRMLKTQLSFVMPLYEQMGNSAEIVKVNESVKCVAPTNFTVVIYGETGSGKELIAQSIHNRSPRCDKPFVVVDCGSIPETLIESELFGFEKGAFTGADQKKVGQFEIASGGTLFLDEIGNLPKSMQGKLLRVLQERRIRRLGSNKEIDVDVRVVVAGNERLEYLIESGHFRMDLYQRLNEFCIEIPPLRRRKDDIVFLCKRFLDITNKELNKNVRGITKETLEMLLTYNWPGNVRELKNVIRRAVLLASEVIEPKHLLIKIQEQKQQASPATGQIASTANRDADHTIPQDLDMNNGKDFSLRDTVARCVEHAEKKLITEALKRTGGNKSQAARILKIDYKTMHYKVKNYGI